MRTTIELKTSTGRRFWPSPPAGRRRVSELIGEAVDVYLKTVRDDNAKRRRALAARVPSATRKPKNSESAYGNPRVMALIVADSDVLIDYLNDINPGADRIEVDFDE